MDQQTFEKEVVKSEQCIQDLEKYLQDLEYQLAIDRNLNYKQQMDLRHQILGINKTIKYRKKRLNNFEKKYQHLWLFLILLGIL
jgi:hypothetical protein